MNAPKPKLLEITDKDRTPLVNNLMDVIAWQDERIERLEKAILEPKNEGTKLNTIKKEQSDTAPVLFSKPLKTLYIIALLAGIGVGTFNPLVSVFFEQHSVDTVLIGAIASLFFLMIAIAAPLVERILRSSGIRRTMTIGFAITGISAIIFPLQNDIWLWFGIRLIMGIGSAFYMIAGQAALNHYANDKNRAFINGIYGLTFGIGMGIGPIIGPILYSQAPFIAFAAGGLLLISGIAVVYWGIPKSTATLVHPSSGLLGRLKIPLAAVFAYGFAEAALLTMYPVYLMRLNFTTEQLGWSVGLFIIGGMFSTLPFSHLGDRIGHTRILTLSVSLGIIGLILILLSEDIAYKMGFSMVAGAGFGPVFVLALALLGDILKKTDLPAGSALFTAVFSLGSTYGPWISSLSLEHFGMQHVFTPTISIFVLFILLTLVNQLCSKNSKPAT